MASHWTQDGYLLRAGDRCDVINGREGRYGRVSKSTCLEGQKPTFCKAGMLETVVFENVFVSIIATSSSDGFEVWIIYYIAKRLKSATFSCFEHCTSCHVHVEGHK